MWTTKEFKTREAFNNFWERNQSKYQMTEIFINSGYCIEYRPLKVIDIP